MKVVVHACLPQSTDCLSVCLSVNEMLFDAGTRQRVCVCVCVGVCVRSPQRPTRTHGFSPQCTFPTMYRWYV